MPKLNKCANCGRLGGFTKSAENKNCARCGETKEVEVKVVATKKK